VPGGNHASKKEIKSPPLQQGREQNGCQRHATPEEWISSFRKTRQRREGEEP
jgi:hypothetical protein